MAQQIVESFFKEVKKGGLEINGANVIKGFRTLLLMPMLPWVMELMANKTNEFQSSSVWNNICFSRINLLPILKQIR